MAPRCRVAPWLCPQAPLVALVLAVWALSASRAAAASSSLQSTAVLGSAASQEATSSAAASASTALALASSASSSASSSLLSTGALAAATPIACPAGTSLASRLLNGPAVNSFFSADPSIVTVATVAACQAVAQKVKCLGGKVGFLLFAEQGFRDASGNTFYGNCAFGERCAGLQSGQVQTSYRNLPSASCAPSPPRALTSCPAVTLATATVLQLDTSDPGGMFADGQPNFAKVNTADECKAAAVTTKCLGYGTQFYVFSAPGFYDTTGDLIGNCAYGTACTALKGGANTATVGSVVPFACPPPPPPAATRACPSANGTINVNPGNVYSLGIFQFGIGHLTQASSLANCLVRAKAHRCKGNVVAFYMYSADGFLDPAGFYYGNCAFGTSCKSSSIIQGTTAVQAGPVAAQACPPSPPPPPPSVPLACPLGTTAKALAVDASKLFSFFRQQNLAVIDVAGGASACRAQAQFDLCSGNPGSFFVYQATGFLDPNNGLDYIGNCAYGDTCTTLVQGSTAVVAGNTISCPPPPTPPPRPPLKPPPKRPPPRKPPPRKPPPRKPPPKKPPPRKPPPKSLPKPPPQKPKTPPPPPGYVLKLCKGAVRWPWQCQCPPWSRCQKKSFCFGWWVCRCLGERKRRIEDPKTGKLLKCVRSRPR